MARTKFTSDYIPTYADIEAIRAKQQEWQATHPDPRHNYIAEYDFNGQHFTENVFALSIKDAEEHVKQQCSIVGIFPYNLLINAIEDTNVTIS